MSAFQFQVPTNPTPGSRRDVTSHHMPARAFFFIVVDEVGKDGFLVRNVYATPTNPYLTSMDLSPLVRFSQTEPEKYGLMPKKMGSASDGGRARHGPNHVVLRVVELDFSGRLAALPGQVGVHRHRQSQGVWGALGADGRNPRVAEAIQSSEPTPRQARRQEPSMSRTSTRKCLSTVKGFHPGLFLLRAR